MFFLSSSTIIVAEGDLVRFAVIRKYDISLPEKVRVNSQNGSAKAGVDFERLDRLLLFIPGQRQCNIEIVTFEDNRLGFDLDFTVHLSSASRIGEPSILYVEILDVCTD
jgi:Calx-beta domain